MPVYRLLVVPRRRDLESEAADLDEGRQQRLAALVALVSAYHAGPAINTGKPDTRGAVLVGWRRAQAHGPVEVLIGATP